MQWQDKAVILSARKFGEDAAIISAFTAERGLCRGLVRHVAGKKNRGIYQAGNLVELTWRGRLAEQLGSFSAELSEAIPALCLTSPLSLLAVEAVCALVEQLLPEHEPNPQLQEQMETLLRHIRDDQRWLPGLVYFELEALMQGGFCLDLSACAATGQKEALCYVSPKTGRAVSRTAGLPYHDKLLCLPSFLAPGYSGEEVLPGEIHKGLALCRYFFHKYIFMPLGREIPAARLRLEELLLATGNASLASDKDYIS